MNYINTFCLDNDTIKSKSHIPSSGFKHFGNWLQEWLARQTVNGVEMVTYPVQAYSSMVPVSQRSSIRQPLVFTTTLGMFITGQTDTEIMALNEFFLDYYFLRMVIDTCIMIIYFLS